MDGQFGESSKHLMISRNLREKIRGESIQPSEQCLRRTRWNGPLLSLLYAPSILRYASGMDISKMLAELRQERAQMEEAIIVLERLALGHGKRRGRPPAWMKAASARKRRGRPPGSKNKPTSA
jgi:hypothetical protein